MTTGVTSAARDGADAPRAWTASARVSVTPRARAATVKGSAAATTSAARVWRATAAIATVDKQPTGST